MNDRLLVIGGDGLIGGELAALLRTYRFNVITTTRNIMLVDNQNCIYLDLSSEDTSILTLFKFSAAFFCAGVTSIAECEDNNFITRKINVTNTIKLAKKLISNGTHIIYISSSAVFDGNIAWPNENSLCTPSCEYGKQKLFVETQLLSSSTPESPVTVVRLTKVLPRDGGIVTDFICNYELNLAKTPFRDLYICPISIRYVVEAIFGIYCSSIQGIFHLSGEREISYADLVITLANKIGINQSLIRTSLVEDTKIRTIYRPTHTGLGMNVTHEKIGIQPERFNDMMNLLVVGYKSITTK